MAVGLHDFLILPAPLLATSKITTDSLVDVIFTKIILALLLTWRFPKDGH